MKFDETYLKNRNRWGIINLCTWTRKWTAINLWIFQDYPNAIKMVNSERDTTIYLPEIFRETRKTNTEDGSFSAMRMRGFTVRLKKKIIFEHPKRCTDKSSTCIPLIWHPMIFSYSRISKINCEVNVFQRWTKRLIYWDHILSRYLYRSGKRVLKIGWNACKRVLIVMEKNLQNIFDYKYLFLLVYFKILVATYVLLTARSCNTIKPHRYF